MIWSCNSRFPITELLSGGCLVWQAVLASEFKQTFHSSVRRVTLVLGDLTCKAYGSNNKQHTWEILYEEEKTKQNKRTIQTKQRRKLLKFRPSRLIRHAVEILLSETAANLSVISQTLLLFLFAEFFFCHETFVIWWRLLFKSNKYRSFSAYVFELVQA